VYIIRYDCKISQSEGDRSLIDDEGDDDKLLHFLNCVNINSNNVSILTLIVIR